MNNREIKERSNKIVAGIGAAMKVKSATVIKVEQAPRHKARVGEQSGEDYKKHLEKRFGVPMNKEPETLEDLKTLYEEGTLEALYSCTIEGGKNAIILGAENGFKMIYDSKPNWICIMHYQRLAIDEDPRKGFEWIVETSYEHQDKEE